MRAFRSPSLCWYLDDWGTEIQVSDQLRRLYKSWPRLLRDDGRGLAFVPLFGSLIRGGTTCWLAYGKSIRDSIETCRCNAAPSLTSVSRVKISRIGLRDLLCFDDPCPKPLSDYSDSCSPRCQQRSARSK